MPIQSSNSASLIPMSTSASASLASTPRISSPLNPSSAHSTPTIPTLDLPLDPSVPLSSSSSSSLTSSPATTTTTTTTTIVPATLPPSPGPLRPRGHSISTSSVPLITSNDTLYLSSLAGAGANGSASLLLEQSPRPGMSLLLPSLSASSASSNQTIQPGRHQFSVPVPAQALAQAPALTRVASSPGPAGIASASASASALQQQLTRGRHYSSLSVGSDLEAFSPSLFRSRSRSPAPGAGAGVGAGPGSGSGSGSGFKRRERSGSVKSDHVEGDIFDVGRHDLFASVDGHGHGGVGKEREREREREKGEGRRGVGVTPPNASPSGWWGSPWSKEKEKEGDGNGDEDEDDAGGLGERRPWKNVEKRKKTIPEEHQENYLRTRDRVAKAAASVLGTSLDVAHDVLTTGIDLLEFAPIPGLATVARTLLNIWDAVESVDMNRLSCLRLTERCAEILLSVRQEIHDAGDNVAEELAQPIEKLTEAFDEVHIFLQKQVHRPFLKRYLKRDEIMGQIQACDKELSDALEMFSISVQIRILKEVQASDLRRHLENQQILESILRMGSPQAMHAAEMSDTVVSKSVEATRVQYSTSPPPAYGSPGGMPTSVSASTTDSTTTTTTTTTSSTSFATSGSADSVFVPGELTPLIHMPIPNIPPVPEPSQVLPALKGLYSLQNKLDAASDVADLRSLMRAALQTSSDMELIRVLQVKRDEMPEAIKTLQRALEREVERERESFSAGSPAYGNFGSGSSGGISSIGGVVGMMAGVGGFALGGRRISSAQRITPVDSATAAPPVVPTAATGTGTATGLGVGGRMLGSRAGTSRGTAGSISSADSASALSGLAAIGEAQILSTDSPAQVQLKRSQTISSIDSRTNRSNNQLIASSVTSTTAVTAATASASGAVPTGRTVESPTEETGSLPAAAAAAAATAAAAMSIETQFHAQAQLVRVDGQPQPPGLAAAERQPRDTLDREFMESGIDALRRLSRGMGIPEDMNNLPSWTITRYEVDRDAKIGLGFFSDVYKGTWRSKAVAIKVLAETTPRDLFINEIKIWKGLKHRNVLELYGASSASSDPPWFFVSPYLRNGSLVEYLKRLVEKGSSANPGAGIMCTTTPTVGTSGARAQTPGAINKSKTVAAGHHPSISHESAIGLGLGGMGSGANPGGFEMSKGNSAVGGGRRTSSMSTAPGYPNWSGWKFPDSKPSSPMSRRESVIAGLIDGAVCINGGVPKEWDLLRYMYEIAKGMEYLHSRGVLHGDLKAANILVDDRIHCVISDFGQSEMKSEAYRISGTPMPHGTLRWQAPELLLGYNNGQLTNEIDVYAFAVSCVELLLFGKIPWPYVSDEIVRHMVTRENARPTIPEVSPFTSAGLRDLLHRAWNQDPFSRPTFSTIVKELKSLHKSVNNIPEEPVSPTDPSSPLSSDGASSAIPVSATFTSVSSSMGHETPAPATFNYASKFVDGSNGQANPSPDMKPVPLPYGSTPPQNTAAGILTGGSYAVGCGQPGGHHDTGASTAGEELHRMVAESPQIAFQPSSYPQSGVMKDIMSQHQSAFTRQAHRQSQSEQIGRPEPTPLQPPAPPQHEGHRPGQKHIRQATHPNGAYMGPGRAPVYRSSPLLPPMAMTQWEGLSTPATAVTTPPTGIHMPEPVFFTPTAMESQSTIDSTHVPESMANSRIGRLTQPSSPLATSLVLQPASAPTSATETQPNTGEGQSKANLLQGPQKAKDMSRTSTTSQSTNLGDEHNPAVDDETSVSEKSANAQNERRYRMLLQHEYHTSLTLPLWEPSVVLLGDVGYLSKPEGRFTTLFNSFRPDRSEDGLASSLPRLRGYGNIDTGNQRQDRRNAAQRGYDAFMGFIMSKRGGNAPQTTARRHAFPLRAGHKAAYLCVESTMYRYVESLDVPKKWLKLHINQILGIYGKTHHVQKEDIFLVIGTLSAPDYGLFVSHNHPDGRALFNVYSAPRVGLPWGTFSLDKDTKNKDHRHGPSYDEPVSGTPHSAFKVSNIISSAASAETEWRTVLVARLRFKPDVAEPTSL